MSRRKRNKAMESLVIVGVGTLGAAVIVFFARGLGVI